MEHHPSTARYPLPNTPWWYLINGMDNGLEDGMDNGMEQWDRLTAICCTSWLLAL